MRSPGSARRDVVLEASLSLGVEAGAIGLREVMAVVPDRLAGLATLVAGPVGAVPGVVVVTVTRVVAHVIEVGVVAPALILELALALLELSAQAARAQQLALALLDELIASELTNDYWTITLPSDLATSSARNPQLFAYVASQNRLGARVLFSGKAVSELIDPALKATKKPLERHHLFPRGWLEGNGVEDLREINQMANYALLEWPDNIDIGKKAPAVYFTEIEQRFAGQPGIWSKMLADHALPDGWQHMSYPEFLQARRVLMADIIRKGFESL